VRACSSSSRVVRSSVSQARAPSGTSAQATNSIVTRTASDRRNERDVGAVVTMRQ
jgi:hypothetical protein